MVNAIARCNELNLVEVCVIRPISRGAREIHLPPPVIAVTRLGGRPLAVSVQLDSNFARGTKAGEETT